MSDESETAQVYVSITGLRLKPGLMARLRFWPLAIASMIQAKRAGGNLYAGAREINGVQHTLTVWRSDEDMRRFIRSGAHARAMRAFRKIAEGKTFGYWTPTAPSWDEVPELWRDHGQRY